MNTTDYTELNNLVEQLEGALFHYVAARHTPEIVMNGGLYAPAEYRTAELAIEAEIKATSQAIAAIIGWNWWTVRDRFEADAWKAWAESLPTHITPAGELLTVSDADHDAMWTVYTTYSRVPRSADNWVDAKRDAYAEIAAIRASMTAPAVAPTAEDMAQLPAAPVEPAAAERPTIPVRDAAAELLTAWRLQKA